MQVISRCKRELEAPSDSEERKKLEEQIQGYESLIKKMDMNGAGVEDTLFYYESLIKNKKWIRMELEKQIQGYESLIKKMDMNGAGVEDTLFYYESLIKNNG